MPGPASEDRADQRIGTTVAGRYFVHRRLGSGGAGVVYQATELGPDRPVALKLFEAAEVPDLAAEQRFEREAAAAASLRHPSCIEILASGRTDDGVRWMAMELVPGRDLAHVLADDGPFTLARAGHVADRVLAVLAEAHAAGIVHRDLKPANVMVAPLPEGPELVKVLDFGIAALIAPAPRSARLTEQGTIYGTPAYMSPEQLRGEPLDGRSDLYAVGILLFEMLAGAPPFDAPTPMAVAVSQLTEVAPALAERRPGVPPALAVLVARALERDREARPASAGAMRTALAAALAGEPPSTSDRPPPLAPTRRFQTVLADRPPARARPRRRVALVLAGAALAAFAVLAVLPRLAPGTGGPGTASTGGDTPAGARLEPPPAAALEPSLPPTPAAAAPAPASPPGTRPAPPMPAGRRRAAAEEAAPASTSPLEAEPLRPAEPTPRPGAIRLVRGELNAIPTPAPETGDAVLVLQAMPWAEVSVDGTPLGETPREVRLAAGVHQVRAVHPELGVREERVSVRPGERALWFARFSD